MALSITTEKERDMATKGDWVADRDVFLNAAKSRTVNAGQQARFLLARKGDTVPAATVKQYKLKNQPKPNAKPKADKKPKVDKAVKKGDDK